MIFFFLFVTSATFAQKKITSVNISDEILHAYVDRVGELYVVTKNGQIQKFDVNGQLISLYKRASAPTLFDPRDGSRLFAFFKESRKIEYLNPSFEVTAASLIDSAFVIDPWLACSSGDHNLWILDAADESVKKFSPATSSILVDVKVPEKAFLKFMNISFVREYQGFLFLLDQNGIHILNGMGHYIKSISSTHLRYFNFIGEELYYPVNNSLVFINLFSGEQRQIPIAQPFQIALLTDERLFLIQSNSIDFFAFKP